MFSTENFYFILHECLLKPNNVHDAVHLTFGSNSGADLRPNYYNGTKHLYGKPMYNYPMAFFFDQEPLDENGVWQNLHSWVFSRFKLLANSEHSKLKQKILNEGQYLDWYFFFHGFAALGWFRDAKYLPHSTKWTRPYISMNRLYSNDRSYRLNLVAKLGEASLIEKGHVSLALYDNSYLSWQDEINNQHSKLSENAKKLIAQIMPQFLWGLKIDRDNLTGNASADFGHNEFNLWQSGLWHLVTETVFYHNKQHLTEKIFKPIVSKRPFMLVAAPGNLAYLKSYGFKTFDRWIDESYDSIQDNDQRIAAIVEQTKKICALSNSQLEDMYREMQDILDYNYEHLWNDFRKIITYELVDNFETSCRIWNNGRVRYGFDIDSFSFANAKKILLR